MTPLKCIRQTVGQTGRERESGKRGDGEEGETGREVSSTEEGESGSKGRRDYAGGASACTCACVCVAHMYKDMQLTGNKQLKKSISTHTHGNTITHKADSRHKRHKVHTDMRTCTHTDSHTQLY